MSNPMMPDNIPTIYPDDSARARRTDFGKGRKRPNPMTRYRVAENGCWEWLGFVGKTGYGQCWTGTAHRHFYRNLVGEIPAGMHVDHICHVPEECVGGSACRHRRCVNPDHLRVVTPRENVLRSNSFVAINASSTHCPEGHPYEGDNLVILAKQRTCRICARRRDREGKARIKSRTPNLESLNRSEERVYFAILRRPMTDFEISDHLADSGTPLGRQTVSQARSALLRGGLIQEAGIRSKRAGTRPSTVWSTR